MTSTYIEPFELRIVPGKRKHFNLSDGLSPTTKISELRKMIADHLGESQPETLMILHKGKILN
jgi:hypothetical protein